jgi:hypothetical protein
LTSSFGLSWSTRLALELDRPLGDIAALGAQQVGNGFQGRGFARPVRAQQCDDFALGHVERNPFQHQNHMVVNDLDVVDGQIAFSRRRGLGRAVAAVGVAWMAPRWLVMNGGRI